MDPYQTALFALIGILLAGQWATMLVLLQRTALLEGQMASQTRLLEVWIAGSVTRKES